jgi:hypothetical protein
VVCHTTFPGRWTPSHPKNTKKIPLIPQITTAKDVSWSTAVNAIRLYIIMAIFRLVQPWQHF